MHDDLKSNPHESRENDFPELSFSCQECDQSGTPRIDVAAKAVAQPQISSAPPCQSPEESENGDESMEWRRKAASRRLRANREDGETGPAGEDTGYAPQFVARRMPDWTPAFDQAPDDADSGVGNCMPPVSRQMNYRWHWLVIAGIALAILLAAGQSVLLWKLERAALDSQTASRNAPTTAPPDEFRPVLDMVPQVRALLERFFTATTVADKIPLVRGGAALLPAMQSYYASHPDEPALLTMERDLKFAKTDGRQFVFATGLDAGHAGFEAAVEVMPDALRIDWRYLTGTGDMEWQRWIDERPTRPVLHRVFVALDDYYAGAFGDSKSWTCVKATDISRNSTVWAYAEHGSPVWFSLMRKVSDAHRPVRLHAALEFPSLQGPSAATALAPQVLLRSIEEAGWIDCSPDTITSLPGAPQ